jgi:thiol:disulfide interchange protein
MQKTSAKLLPLVLIVIAMVGVCLPRASRAGPGTASEIAGSKDQFSSAQIVPARMDDQKGVAVVFKGTSDLHYYAKEDTAPAGYNLKIEAKSRDFDFGRAVFPKWGMFEDSLGSKVEVYVGEFTVFVPIEAVRNAEANQAKVEVEIVGIACTSMICLAPFKNVLQATVDYTRADSWKQVSFETANAVEIARDKDQFSSVRIEPARMDGQKGIAVVFEGTDDLHYYASEGAAPLGNKLKVEAQSGAFDFGPALFPQWSIFQDPSGSKAEVYVGRFTVFVPIDAVKAAKLDQAQVEVEISGVACTSTICLRPFKRTLPTTVDYGQADSWKQITIETPGGAKEAARGQSYSVRFALGLAFLAGLILNIMPCVLPVIPLKVLSIFEQAKESKAKCIALGFSFCLGILLFFVGLAVLNIVLRLGYETVFQWGDLFRNPLIVIAMSLLMVVLALSMFDVFSITVPSSIAGKAGPRKGLAGSVAMGFLAAVLSTPCSFAILTAAFAWAQTQRLPLATLAILLIGVGMAAPYAILTSMPSLLKYLPRPGRWTELFKQAMGFLLLIVAVWLLSALSVDRRTPVLYFAVILAFCLWMWGGWVTFSTPTARKWTVRIIALVIALLAGAWLLPKPEPERIDWQEYDTASINSAISEKKPVLIDFMADWCLTCKVVEKTVYSRKDIAELIEQKGVLAIKGDTTLEDSLATLDLKNVYHEPGVPVSILLLPGREEPVRFHGLVIGDKLEQALESLPPQ